MRVPQRASQAMLVKAVRLLLPLGEEVVFLGGLAMALLISDPAAPDVRPTEDVDVIVEVTSYAGYSQLEERLRANGFTQPREEKSVIYRWVKDGLKIDIMPTDESILGFGNRWYTDAMRSAQTIPLTEDLAIRLITAPCFLATKIEAFQSGIRGDFFTGRDMDDIVSVLDGRPEIAAEAQAAAPAGRDFLAGTFREYLRDDDFLEALDALLYPDAASQARRPLILSRMAQIAEQPKSS